MQIENVSDSTAAIIKQQLTDEVCECPKCTEYREQRKPVAMQLPTGFTKW
jgi:hypothetical protein